MEMTNDSSEMEQVVLRNDQGASVRISLYGGQVTSWQNERGEELLFIGNNCASGSHLYLGRPDQDSSTGAVFWNFFHLVFLHCLEIFKPKRAMQGGIPICFPQFGNCGSFEQNGFAKNKIWTIHSQGESFVDLLLVPSAADLESWPHSFKFRLRVSLAIDGTLRLISRIRNIDMEKLSFSFAYHTHLAVSDISDVRIEGLETLHYLDNLKGRERFTEQGNATTFESELDRIYLRTPSAVAVLDHKIQRSFVIRKDGLPDVVVWNPWEKKSKSFLDFGCQDYQHMVCVGAAAIEKPITLKPGEEWKGCLEIKVVPSSISSNDF